jgi:crotonobetainyl-CoA:carnitine CoA-transferase CaiB-like acyl-CoA transferase
MNAFSHVTVLSIEQATTLPYLTLHLAQEGMRVIRVENPPRGDPNRWVGANVLGEDGMNAYYLPNNAGKESITLNLGCAEGRQILHTLVEKLPVDVFATNQRPKDYAKLEIDYETLSRIRPQLIWLGITGFGPESNEAAYDPVMQARSGFMDLTGEPDRTPLVFGLPMVDLGAGEHAYGQVMRALYWRERTGKGSRVDISMFQSAISWMVSPMLLTKSFGQSVERRGNTHQFFAPVSVYPTRDGFVYVAVGNDKQWEAITAAPEFASLATEGYHRNTGRIAAVKTLDSEMREIIRTKTTEEWIQFFGALGVPISRVNSIRDVVEDPLVSRNLLTIQDPRTGAIIHLPAPVVLTEFLRDGQLTMKFPPRLGEDNEKVLGALGHDVVRLRERNII